MTDGIHNLTIEEYHANDTHLSSSQLKPILNSLGHFWHEFNNKEAQSKNIVLDFGNAFELFLTNESEFSDKVAIFETEKRPQPDKDFRIKDNKDFKKYFFEKNKDKYIINDVGEHSFEVIEKMASSFVNHTAARNIIENSEPQISLFWTCKKTGIKLKTRPDFFKKSNKKRGGIIADLKTDKNSTTDKHFQSIINNHYAFQATIQIEGLRHFKLIDDYFSYYWVFCSKIAPFNTEVYEFDQEDIKLFNQIYYEKLTELKKAQKKGEYLTYNKKNNFGIKQVEFPFFYKKQLGIFEEIGDKI